MSSCKTASDADDAHDGKLEDSEQRKIKNKPEWRVDSDRHGRYEGEKVENHQADYRRPDDSCRQIAVINEKPDEISRKYEREKNLKAEHVGERRHINQAKRGLPRIKHPAKLAHPDCDQSAIPAEPLRNERRNGFGYVGQRMCAGGKADAPSRAP